MLTLRSPAKINLFLRVVGRYPNGYHSLASVFQAISLFDEIHFSVDTTKTESDQLSCTDPTLPTDHSNLILKAADLFRRKTGLSFSLRAHLDKRIPHQAGFGGGSGNAATTLWALNQLCGRPASETSLQEWSGEIGSDIPFFFSHGTAFCTGRGEIVEDLPSTQKINLWIVKPAIGLSTPKVFQQVQLDQLMPRDPLHILKEFSLGYPCYFNDLEEAAFLVHPGLRDLKALLLGAGFHTVLLTGSGSGFFCLGDCSPPNMADLWSYPVSFLNRIKNAWYS